MRKGLTLTVAFAAAGILLAQNGAVPPGAGGANAAQQQGRGGRGRGPQADLPPVTDLTGSWVPAAETAAPTSTMILKQNGNNLTGEYKPTTPLAGLPPIILLGAIGGSQVDVMSLFDYQGGELMHIRLEYKDGHLVGQRSSIHSAPRKWRLDTTVEVDYVRRQE
jgi:hypothetical protein